MNRTDYQRTLDWLYALEAAKGMDFKLERVALALRRLGDPQRAFPSIHVAGTNGKGSVAAMLHAVLAAAGYRVGLYTSPHLVRFTERIRIGADDVAEADVVALADEVRRIASGHGIELTFFEFITVMALVHFARRGVDVAVIEVGLGGRLDATNVIDPLLSVITTIGLDHTEFLGDTLASIAAEKGGIIKAGRLVVLGSIEAEPARVLHEIAAERRARVIAAGRDYRLRAVGERLHFQGVGWDIDAIELGLRAHYQRDNAATALAALAAVRATLPLSETAVRQGLAAVQWPGRFDVIDRAPLTILDGAHNREGVRVLADELRPLVQGRRVHALFAVMRDKPWSDMVDILAPLCANAVIAEVLPPRGESPERVAERFAAYCPTRVCRDPVDGWSVVSGQADAADIVLVTGSLFLIGAVYPLCRAAGAAARPASGTQLP